MTAVAPATRTAVVFRVGARALAADASTVAAVAKRPALTRVPQAPPALAGLAALEGRSTPVIELAGLVGGGEGGGPQLLVLRGDDPVAVAVDRVEGLHPADAVSADWLDLRATVAPVFAVSAPAGRRIAGADPATETVSERRERELSFLQFTVAGQRFAFPINEVRAVLRVPDELQAIPGADPVVIGAASHAGGVLPVVELADLLGLPRAAASPEARLFVVEIGEALAGLRVERALGALRLTGQAVSAASPLLNRGAGEARVSAIARTPTGLTAVLSAARLFDEDTMARLGALASPPSPQEERSSDANGASVVVFRLGEERYGLPAEAVEAIGRAPAELSPPPNAPPFLAGVMSHRGEATPLVRQALRFGSPAQSAPRAVVFVRSGPIAAGLLVDAVEGVARLAGAELEAAPSLAMDAGALFAQVSATALDGRPLLIADPQSLLGQALRDLTAWTAAHPPRARA